MHVGDVIHTLDIIIELVHHTSMNQSSSGTIFAIALIIGLLMGLAAPLVL